MRQERGLTFIALITTTADDTLKYCFVLFSEKISLDILCESSALQMIHMKCQVFFSLKNNNQFF